VQNAEAAPVTGTGFYHTHPQGSRNSCHLGDSQGYNQAQAPFFSLSF